MNNITAVDLKKVMLASPRFYREHLLTDKQLTYFDFVYLQGNEGCTSSELARRYGLSLQAASAALTTLYKKHYLNRMNQGDPTGGKQYVYRTIKL